MIDFIAYADGSNDLIDISNIIGVPVNELLTVIEKLEKVDLLTRCDLKMEKLTNCDFETLHRCPWGGDETPTEFLYKDFMGCEIVRCQECGLVFAKRKIK